MWSHISLMWSRISLKNRIYIHLAGLFLVTLSGAAVMVWYSLSMGRVLTAITDENLVTFQSAQTLEFALINQKGFISYYFQDGDAKWLEQLDHFRRMFSEQLGRARALATTPAQHAAIDRIADEYDHYISEKNQVLAHYKNGAVQFGSKLNQDVRNRFFAIMEMCEAYKQKQTEAIIAAKQDALIKAARLRDTAMAVIVTHILLLFLLAYLLVHQILNPVRALVLETQRNAEMDFSGNDVKNLRASVRGLIEDVGQTQEELERSRENLLQAEKMAMVGKLAAGMAHSIRNPFTSIKMRIFSLSRSLKLGSEQREDFDVISEEIDHIDTIVQNFLEFSRPPKLKMQPLSPSTIVDTAIQLLHYRLESYRVSVTVDRRKTLPAVDADPEQLKEVLLNLIINACEAMHGNGGKIEVQERLIGDGGPPATSAPGAPAAAGSSPNKAWAQIRIRDDGPGIAKAVVNKIFSPFFTTKEDGTGLGLSIVQRIIGEHGGRIEVESEEGCGTVFTIALPLRGRPR